MIWPEAPDAITVEGWDPADEPRRESLFGLGNGVVFSRAAAPEAAPGGPHYPGTYVAGCYDALTGAADGRPVRNESLVNLPNWLPLSFRPAGEEAWFAPETVEILAWRQSLDPACGIAAREIAVRDRQGRHTTLRERRLVSLMRDGLLALRWEIVPEDWSGAIELRSAVEAGIVNARVARHAPFPHHHLDILALESPAPDTVLAWVRTRCSRIEVAVAARTRLIGGAPAEARIVRAEASIACHLRAHAEAGQALVVEKIAALATARDPASGPARAAACAAVASAPGFDEIARVQRRAWDRLWRRGATEARQAAVARTLRLHAFHVLQTVSPRTALRDAGLPSRGWQEAYHGQIFWDEIFAFPYLTLRFPDCARALLLYRYRRLEAARAAAHDAGYRGAMFPWRSATDGREVTPAVQLNPLSGRWMQDHTYLQRHVGAAIAFNILHYVAASGDADFLVDHGAEMLVEIARFWASAARPDAATGRHDYRGVIGPDEYHNAYPGAARPGLDTNAYTNAMAAWTLLHAAEALDRLPRARREELALALDLDPAEPDEWERIATSLRIAFHDDGVIAQFAGFDRLRPLDIAALRRANPGRRVDWLLEARGETADAYQVTKQPDVLMLLYLLPGRALSDLLGRMGYRLERAQMRRTTDYYLARMTHESSLSRVVCAGALARLDPATSWAMFRRALRIDLDPAESGGAAEGLHLGAMAGTLDVVQRHYLGLLVGADAITLDPAPPPVLGPVRFRFRCRFGGFALAWTGEELRLEAAADNPAAACVRHAGGEETLSPGRTLAVRPG